MPNCLACHVAAIGKFYPLAVRLATQKLNFITPQLIPAALALLNYDIKTSFIVYIFASFLFGACRTEGQSHVYKPLRSTKNKCWIGYTISSTLLLSIILQLLLTANDIHPNPGPNTYHTSDSLSIIHINANQITNKIDTIAYEARHYDIITISETFLHTNSKKERLKIDGFHEPIRKDRNQDGGGVAIYVKMNMLCKHRADLDVPELEAVWVETNLNKEKILIGSFFRPPSKPISYWDLIDKSIKQASYEPFRFFVFGDFNSDFLNNPSIHLINLINFNNMTQVIDVPTRITQTTASCLDLIMTSSVDLIKASGVLPPICSDHSVPYIQIYLSKPSNSSYRRTIYNYSNLNANKLISDLTKINLLD